MKTYYNQPRLPRNYTPMTDRYEYTMTDGFSYYGVGEKMAYFDVFFRKIPSGGGYAIMAGLDQVIPYIEGLKYDKDVIKYFEDHNYPKEQIEELKNFKFHGSIYAVPDGTPVFPNEPILTAVGPINEIQTIETAILAIFNGAILSATAARRIVEAAPKDCEVYDILPRQEELLKVMEFGARRAPGLEAAINSSIYGIMAGCVATSNVQAAMMCNLDAKGTIAHSWVQRYANIHNSYDEFEAFKKYALRNPDNCILLIDSYDTLRSGLPNAIRTFKYMQENGIETNHIGVRIDSGDLAYLSKVARKVLDEEGFPQATICLSNGLKAETIESLILQGAKFNSLGVGDNISKPEGNMGCVYKEVAFEEVKGIIDPTIKLSNDAIKITNPGYKKVYRVFDNKTGYALADVITEADKKLPEDNLVIVSQKDRNTKSVLTNYRVEELQKPIFINGDLVYDDPELLEKQAYCSKQMATLYPEVKRTLNPHEYYVDGTEEYIEMKFNEIEEVKSKVRTKGVLKTTKED